MKTQAGMMRTLILGVVALLIVLVGAAFVTNAGEESMDERAHALTLDALPSIEHLTDACDALRDLEAHADDYAGLPAETQATGRVVLDDDWRRIDRELSDYLSLPGLGGERALYESTIPSALRTLDEAVSRLTAAVEAGEPGRARTMADREVGPAAKEAAKRLRAMVRINSTDGYAAVEQLGGKHRDFARLHLVFDALAVAVGIGLALLLSLQFRAHGRLAREHSALVERQVSELEVFAQRVAHDLLSPLSALTYCLGAFKRVSESDPKLQDALTRARGCVARARRMVDAIFDFARAGGRPQPGARAELREALDEATEALREVSAGETPEVTVEPFASCIVGCSRGVLSSILGNLLSNAEKYMRDSAEKRITVRVREKGAVVWVEVEDTGPGVPKDLEGRLFEPYVRGDGVTQPGLGLGLATVKRLCTAHGGDIGARSTTGHGSIFWFTLPVAADLGQSEPQPRLASVSRIR